MIRTASAVVHLLPKDHRVAMEETNARRRKLSLSQTQQQDKRTFADKRKDLRKSTSIIE